jgi:hypothetical protein
MIQNAYPVTHDGGLDYEAWLRELDGEPDGSLPSSDGGTPAAAMPGRRVDRVKPAMAPPMRGGLPGVPSCG